MAKNKKRMVRMWKGINGDVAFTLDGHYYLGCGARGGREREVVYWVDDMQDKTGTLNPGAHPGSYNGQDAYNDMLVVKDGKGVCASGDRDLQGVRNGFCNQAERSQGCHGLDFEGGGVK